MMKKLYFSMLLVAGLALAACSSDDSDNTPVIKTYTMTVDATKGTNDAIKHIATRALSLEGSTLNASWATSEHVYVQGQLVGGDYFWFKGNIQPQSAGTTTRLNGTISLPDGWAYPSIEAAIGEAHPTLTLQFPRSGELDYTGQVGTLADIAAKYDYATATISVDIIEDRIVPYLDYEEAPVDFKNQQAIVKFTLKDKADGTTLLNPTALTVRVEEPETGTLIDEVTLSSIPDATYTTNGDGVLFVAIQEFEAKKVILTATVGGKTYTFIRSGVTFVNGKYYEINVQMVAQS